MKKSKMMLEAFRVLSRSDIRSKDDLTVALNKFLENMGLPTVCFTGSERPEIENKSLPTFDTLDFDEITEKLEDA